MHIIQQFQLWLDIIAYKADTAFIWICRDLSLHCKRLLRSSAVPIHNDVAGFSSKGVNWRYWLRGGLKQKNQH